MFVRSFIYDLKHEIRLHHAAHYIQGNFAEAERLYERCQAIDEKVLGPDHPDLATTLNNRAALLSMCSSA